MATHGYSTYVITIITIIEHTHSRRIVKETTNTQPQSATVLRYTPKSRQYNIHIDHMLLHALSSTKPRPHAHSPTLSTLYRDYIPILFTPNLYMLGSGISIRIRIFPSSRPKHTPRKGQTILIVTINLSVVVILNKLF